MNELKLRMRERKTTSGLVFSHVITMLVWPHPVRDVVAADRGRRRDPLQFAPSAGIT